MSKFLNLIRDSFQLINEEDPVDAPSSTPPSADALPEIPVTDAPVDQSSQQIADVDVARRLALLLPNIDSNDRTKLIVNTSEATIDSIRQTLNDILNIHDTPA